jgi:ABC-type transport system involved in multi-copper enzyme maturation permease subunit
MTPTNILFVAIGAVSLLLGIAVLIAALRGAPGTDPKSTAMLIAGMMITAFGLLMAGFAIAYSTAPSPAEVAP